MPPMRMSIITRLGLSLGRTLSPSSPLVAVVNSISAESKMRRKEYCTSASSSISSNLSILVIRIGSRVQGQRDADDAALAGRRMNDVHVSLVDFDDFARDAQAQAQTDGACGEEWCRGLLRGF